MKTYERFLNYVRIHTASSEDSSSVPTTERQFDLANLLVKELHAIGVENARVDDKCYVYASVAATPGCESCPRNRLHCAYGHRSGFFRRKCSAANH